MPAASLWNSFQSWRHSGMPAEEFFRRMRVNRKKQKSLLEKWDALQTSQGTGTDSESSVCPSENGEEESKRIKKDGGVVRGESELLVELKVPKSGGKS